MAKNQFNVSYDVALSEILSQETEQ